MRGEYDKNWEGEIMKEKQINLKFEKVVTKKFITYGRHEFWNGEPCKYCGTTEPPDKTEGKFIAGSKEEGNLMFVCGKCQD